MNIHIGPQSKEKFRQENLAKLGKYKALFWVIFLVGPLTLIALNKFHLIKPWVIRNDGQGSVALVITDGGTGSAFNVSSTAWITAQHVIRNLSGGDGVELQLTISKINHNIDAKIKYQSADENLDFAFLKTTGDYSNADQHFTLSDFNNVSLGDEVIIIGYPAGIYSYAKSQVINLGFSENPNLFLMAGNAWPGNSGGPIVHSKTGEVIGVLIAGFENEYKGMVVGLKINEVKNSLEQQQ